MISRRNVNRSVTSATGITAALAVLGSSTQAFAAEGIPKFINYYDMILRAVLPAGEDKAHLDHLVHDWLPVAGALFITLVIAIVGLRFKSQVEKDDQIVPDGKFGLRFIIEGILEFVHGIGKENCGANYRNYLPLLSGIFIFILFCNVSGLIPGFPPPTESMATNVAMGLIVFFVYNFAGIKEHGAGYIKQFFGPVAFIAPLFFAIEIFSHAMRPFSLGLRLTCNIFGDHLLLGVFTGMLYVIVPSALLFFGLLVSVVQSFVFTLLTGLYISMAISHDH